MRDDELRERLLDQNPWWRAAAAGWDCSAWVETDQALRARAPYDLGYRSDLLDDIATGPLDDKLVVLRGPRRVGKSVLLKDTAAKICDRSDVDPRQLIYVPTDGMRATDLSRVVKLGRELTRSVGEVSRVWLLDEVTGISGWTEELKYLRDNSSFGADTVVCTGSSWDDESDLERDLLAGRVGTSSLRRLRILHPMTFREVLAATGRATPMPPRLRPWEIQDESARTALEALEYFVDDLDLAWQAFLTSGGFPRAVAEYDKNGEVSEAFHRDLVAWLYRDVDPEASEDSVPKLLSGIEARCSSPLNRTTFARDLSYATRQTVDKRLKRLVKTYAAVWNPQVGDDGQHVPGSQAKLYLADPILAWLGPRLRAGLRPPDFTRLSEASLGIALARAIDDLEPGRWESGDTIGYLRTRAGREVDFAPVQVRGPSGPVWTVPIEVKWVSLGWRSDAKTIEGKFNAGVIATRSVLDLTKPSWAVPAPIVALLLG